MFFFFKQKTAYEMRISDWSSDVCSSDLLRALNLPVGYDDWRAAVVLSKSGGSATLGFEDGSRGQMPEGNANWPKRGVGGRAFDFLKPGDVIPVKKDGAASARRQIPEGGGRTGVKDPPTGRGRGVGGG